MDGMGKYDDDSDSESGRMGASPQLSKKTLCQKDLLKHGIRLENHSLFFFSRSWIGHVCCWAQTIPSQIV